MPNWGRKGKGNTKFIKFRGKAVYAKPYVPDEYNGAQTWKCGMTVTKAMWEEVRESGSQVKKKLAESIPNIDENTPYVEFKRPTEKEFKNGKAFFCPPFIYDKDGKKLVWYENEAGEDVRQFSEDDKQPERKGEPVIIGNGSEIEVTVGIYPAGSYGHGTRLESIRILDLIEWVPPEDGSDTQSKAMKKTEVKKEEKKEVEDDSDWLKDDKSETDGPGW